MIQITKRQEKDFLAKLPLVKDKINKKTGKVTVQGIKVDHCKHRQHVSADVPVLLRVRELCDNPELQWVGYPPPPQDSLMLLEEMEEEEGDGPAKPPPPVHKGYQPFTDCKEWHFLNNFTSWPLVDTILHEGERMLRCMSLTLTACNIVAPLSVWGSVLAKLPLLIDLDLR